MSVNHSIETRVDEMQQMVTKKNTTPLPLNKSVLQGLSVLDGSKYGLGEGTRLVRLCWERGSMVQSSWGRRQSMQLYRRIRKFAFHLRLLILQETKRTS